MMKYILVLVLFGFFNISLAHEGEEENWVSCVYEHSGKQVCEEINLDHVVYMEYTKIKYTDGSTSTRVHFNYTSDEDNFEDSLENCNLNNLKKGRHCSSYFSEETDE